MSKPETDTSTHALAPAVDLSALSIFSRQKTYKMPITTPNMEEDWRVQRNNELALWSAQVAVTTKEGTHAPPRPNDPPQPTIRDKAGNLAFMEIMSVQDSAVQEWYKANPGINEINGADEEKAAREKIATELMPIMVRSWYWVNPETQEPIELPCTPEIIRAVFMAEEYQHLLMKVINTMAVNRHFFKV